MAKVKTVNLQSLGDSLDTPFITPMSKRLIKAAWKGDLKNFVKYLFSFVWFGTRDYTMALIILTFIVAASKDDTVKEQLNNNVSTGNISRLFEKIGRGDGKELRNFLNGEGKWFKELFEDLLKNHLEFKNDNDGEKKKKAINGLWTKFIKQVEKMTKWKRNENYVRENLCNAIAGALGEQYAKKVITQLPPTPPGNSGGSTDDNKGGKRDSDDGNDDDDSKIEKLKQRAEYKKLEEDYKKGTGIQKADAVAKINSELAKHGAITADYLSAESFKFVIDGLNNMPYAAFGFEYNMPKDSESEDSTKKAKRGDALMPFPRKGNLESYEIIKRIIQKLKSTKSKSFDILYKNIGKTGKKETVNNVLRLAGLDEILKHADLYEQSDRPTIVYTKTQTGESFGDEAIDSLAQYYFKLEAFGKNVLRQQLRKSPILDSTIYMFESKNRSKYEKPKIYKIETVKSDENGKKTVGDFKYLVIDDGTENDIHKCAVNLLTGDLGAKKYVSTSFDKFLEWILESTCTDDNYLKTIPKFLEPGNIQTLEVDVNDIDEEKKRLNDEMEAKKRKEEERAARKEENEMFIENLEKPLSKSLKELIMPTQKEVDDWDFLLGERSLKRIIEKQINTVGEVLEKTKLKTTGEILSFADAEAMKKFGLTAASQINDKYERSINVQQQLTDSLWSLTNAYNSAKTDEQKLAIDFLAKWFSGREMWYTNKPGSELKKDGKTLYDEVFTRSSSNLEGLSVQELKDLKKYIAEQAGKKGWAEMDDGLLIELLGKKKNEADNSKLLQVAKRLQELEIARKRDAANRTDKKDKAPTPKKLEKIKLRVEKRAGTLARNIFGSEIDERNKQDPSTFKNGVTVERKIEGLSNNYKLYYKMEEDALFSVVVPVGNKTNPPEKLTELQTDGKVVLLPYDEFRKDLNSKPLKKLQKVEEADVFDDDSPKIYKWE